MGESNVNPATTVRRELSLRLASSCVFAPPMLIAALAQGSWGWGLALVLGLGAVLECMRLATPSTHKLLLPLFLSSQLLAAAAAWEHGMIGACVVALLSGSTAWIICLTAKDKSSRLAGSCMAYCTMFTGAMFVLGDTYSPVGTTAWLIVVVWAADSGAFVVGKLLRGPLLAPTVSPGKTWSGFVGALIFGTAAGLAMSTFGMGIQGTSIAMCAALTLAAISQAGDLLVSSLKRRAGVKDSSKLIPGHGGILDRVDGLMAASIILAIALSLCGYQFS